MNLKKLNITLGTFILIGLAFIALQIFAQNPPEDSITKPSATEIKTQTERPASFKQLMAEGDLAVKEKNFDEAITKYLRAIELEPKAEEAFLSLAETQLLINQNGKARSNFENVLKLDSLNLDARIGITKSYISERDIEAAKKVIEPIKIKDPRVRYYQGIIFAFLKDYEKSKNAFIEGIAMQSDEETARKTQIFLDAYKEFSLNSGGIEIHIQTLLAKAFVEVGEYQMAITTLFEVVENKSNYRDAWTIMGYAYLAQDNPQNAIDALETAKKLDPDNSKVLFFLGLAYFSGDNLEKAEENLNLALEAGYEPSIQAKQKLAEVKVLLSKYKEAAILYEEIIATKPNDPNIFIRPVWLNIDKLDNPQRALSIALSSLEENPESAMAQNLVGWAYFANKDYLKAKKHLVKAIEMDSTLDAAYYNLGQLYEKNGKIDIALELYKQAQELKKDPSIYKLARDKYAKLIIEKNQFKANTLDPLNP